MPTTEQITKTKFWMVVRYEGVTNASTKHPTYEVAKEEAERLAINNPLYNFVILEGIEIVSLAPSPTVVKKL